MALSPARLESLLARASTAAKEAAEVLERASERPLDELVIQEKHPADFVTQVDRQLEEHFRRTLMPLLPGCAFLGEEGGLEGDAEGLLWVVDPLDGTTNFTRGLQPFGFSVALLEARVPVLGILGVPCQGWLLTAGRGLGTCQEGRKVVLSGRPLGSHTVAGAGLLRGGEVPGWLGPLVSTGARLRFLGSTVAHLAGVALGRLDLAVQGFGRIWDVAGGLVVVGEAGGRMVHLDGRPLAPFTDEELAGAHTDFLTGPPGAVESLLACLGTRITGDGGLPVRPSRLK